MEKPGEHRTVAQVLNGSMSNIEGEFVSAAEAMPEDKFSFAPTSGEFKGVRTFAFQVWHVAASNCGIRPGLAREKFPDNYKGGNGPENLKTQAGIIAFVKDSFALGQRAAAPLTAENRLQKVGKGDRPVCEPVGERTKENFYHEVLSNRPHSRRTLHGCCDRQS